MTPAIPPAAKGVTEPATMYQVAEEHLCTCGAAGSGEGHVDWCDWQSSEWRKWGDAFNTVTHNDATEVLISAAKIVAAVFAGTPPRMLPHNGERALALLVRALAALRSLPAPEAGAVAPAVKELDQVCHDMFHALVDVRSVWKTISPGALSPTNPSPDGNKGEAK